MATVRKKYLHVCLTPALIDQFDIKGAIVVVIDVLRATTSMCVAFDNGAAAIHPFDNIEACRAYKAKGYLTAGERKGEQIEGFDFGNSPFSFKSPMVQNAKIAMTTTNGTKAIQMAVERGARDVVIGAFPNIRILCDWLISQNENVCLLCSGWQDHPNIEDTIFAGAVARELNKDFYYYQDSALMADMLYFIANVRKKYFMRNSSHYNRLIHLNLQEEVKYALRRNTHPVIPVLIGDEIVDVSKFAGDFAEVKQMLLTQRQKELAMENEGVEEEAKLNAPNTTHE